MDDRTTVIDNTEDIEPTVRVRDLSVFIGNEHDARFPVLEDISINLKPGQTLGLVGESGSGKSMTALAIMGLLPGGGEIVAGNIDFEGKDLVGLSEDQYRYYRGRDLAMVFQEPMTALNPVFTVGDQISEVYRTHQQLSRRAARSETIEIMTRVGIADAKRRVDAYPHELSGGMRQRVMIAMAMALRPKLLICDEPTTALDVTIQAQILDLILDLQAETNMAVLFITHDLSLVSEVADDIAVIYGGRIIETSDTVRFFENPLHPYAKALLRALPGHTRPGDTLATIPGQVPKPDQEISGCRFHPRCQSALQRCRHELPPMAEKQIGRQSACWLEE